MADELGTTDPEEKQETPKKSKLLLFIILGITILLIGGGGFFAYTKFLAPQAKTAKTAKTKETPKQPIGQIFSLEPFVVNLADPTGKRYLKVKIDVELETELAVTHATELTPKLRDMVIMMLTSLSFEDVMTPEGKIQIRDELLERFSQVMRPDKIKNIYFTDFVVQ